MPNVLGTLAASQVIIQEALDLIFTMRPMLNDISLGFTDKDGSPYALFNQQVVTRTITVPPVVPFPATPGSRADVDVPVTLNQYRGVWHQFTPQQYSGTNRDLIRESAEPIAVAIANDIVDAIGAVWTLVNFPTRTGADAVANNSTVTKTIQGAGWDYSMVNLLKAVLDKSGVPFRVKRFLAANADVWASLSNDQRIVGYFWNQSNNQAITTGKLSNVAGFNLYEYPGLPQNAINLVAVAGTPDSTVYAQRVAKDPREMPGFTGVPVPGLMSVVTEPMTGLSVNLDLWIDMATRNANIRLSWMYGTAVGNPNNLQLVTTQ